MQPNPSALYKRKFPQVAFSLLPSPGTVAAGSRGNKESPVGIFGLACFMSLLLLLLLPLPPLLMVVMVF